MLNILVLGFGVVGGAKFDFMDKSCTVFWFCGEENSWAVKDSVNMLDIDVMGGDIDGS